MSGDELKLLADHMGHSVAIHTDVYRMQSSVLERTKVARALVALEEGSLKNFQGRNLSSVSLDGMYFNHGIFIETWTMLYLVYWTESAKLADILVRIKRCVQFTIHLFGSWLHKGYIRTRQPSSQNTPLITASYSGQISMWGSRQLLESSTRSINDCWWTAHLWNNKLAQTIEC